MKRLFLLALIPACMLAPRAPADELPPFYRELAKEGSWFKLDGKAWVWQPTAAQLDATWRPYLHGGNWTRNDDNWFWASDYAWGAIAYHYGRWYDSESNGWVWVPGTQWCPAWVDWQLTGTHCGWAPLPPDQAFFSALGRTMPPRDGSRYTFVPKTVFLARDLPGYAENGTRYADAAQASVDGPPSERVRGQPPVIAVFSTSHPVYETVAEPVFCETAPTITIRSYTRSYTPWAFRPQVSHPDHRHHILPPPPRLPFPPPPPFGFHSPVHPRPA